MDKTERYMTLQETAEYLSASQDMVRKLFLNGSIQCGKVGNRFRTKKEYIDDYINRPITEKAPPLTKNKKMVPIRYNRLGNPVYVE